MGAKLFIESGDAPQKAIPWPDELKTIVLGRDVGVFLRLDDDQCSRRHVAITRRFGKYVLRDLNSRNGTLVDDVPVVKTTLRDGSRIHIGNSLIRFAVACPESAPGPALFGDLPEDRVSVLCVISVALGLVGLFVWYVAVAALLLGAVAALNVRLRPKLRGFWVGVLGASLGGAAAGGHYSVNVIGKFWQVSRATQTRLECKRRLTHIRDALIRYRLDHSERSPSALRDLYPDYLDDPDSLYCPVAEGRSGPRSDRAAYVYRPAGRARSPWIVRDPDIETHEDGGHAIDDNGMVRWFPRLKFVEFLRHESP